jgi:hypothetical protein
MELRGAPLTMLVMVGCGGMPEGDIEDPNDVAPAPQLAGSVGVLLVGASAQSGPAFQLAVTAAFESEPSSERCTRSAFGPCELERCDSTGRNDERKSHAARITASVHGRAIAIDPHEEGGYETTFADAALWTPGEPIHIHADGDSIPSFDADIETPAQPQIFEPELGHGNMPLRATRDRPFELVWSSGAAGMMLAAFSKQHGHEDIDITCRFDAGSGAGEVPVELLAQLDDRGMPFRMNMGVVVETPIVADRWNVNAFAYAAAEDARGRTSSRSIHFD